MALTVLGLAWIAGLLAGLHLDLPLPTLALFLLASAGLFPLLRKAGWSWPLALAGLVIVLGLLRVELSPKPDFTVPSGALDTISLHGRIVSSPELAGGAEKFVFQARSIDRGAGEQPYDGKAMVVARPPDSLVEARNPPYFRYGDELLLEGRLTPPAPFEDFDYPAYLERQGIHVTLSFPQAEFLDEGQGNPLRAWLHRVRLGAASRLSDLLPLDQAALAQALLLGKRDSLPDEVRDDFRSSGTSHLLAVSGLHVGVVLFLTIGASAYALGRRRGLYLLAPLLIVWAYAALTGLAPPVQRAAIMATVYLCALAIGRPRSHLPALLLAAAIMAGLTPTALLDVSFQLSFAAVAGIALMLTMMDRERDSAPGGAGLLSGVYRYVMDVQMIGIAATVATLPLIAFNFHQVPTLGILTTILAIPAMPLILGTSLLSLTAHLIYPPLGQAVGWCAWVSLTYVLELTQLVARVPGSTFSVPAIPSALVVAYYAILSLLVMSPRGLRPLGQLVRRWRAGARETTGTTETAEGQVGSSPSLRVAALLVCVAAMTIFLWARVLTYGDGRLHVTFLDVGQGDSILIESPGGARILVDGGPRDQSALRRLDEQSSFWRRNIDLLVLTHGDEDHFGGLVEVARRYDVGGVLQGSHAHDSPLYPAWERVLQEKAVPRLPAVQGQRIDLGEQVRLEVLHPPEGYDLDGLASRNNSGVVLRLAYGEISFLLTADIEAEAEAGLLRRYPSLDSTVLKVAHHGSNTSSTTAFLQSVKPRIAVVSAGEDNPFGHPSPLAMARLEEVLPADRILSTAEHGSIRLSTDGRRLWVHADQ